MKDCFAAFDQGTALTRLGGMPETSPEWNPNPALPGVALKHLVTGKESDGRFSLHLVRLEPGAEIRRHVHEGNWELHQVIHGSGTLMLEDREIPYKPGMAAPLPENEPHAVRAGDDGLGLLAVFSPALL
ncbi:cupin domain-containing protein [Pseudodesulfovibrio sp.]|uniref:cupin domain-containing protein n=1 Tax=unclassified Pseudodesulfovibrio TaxID=2661612 RepID=UPI003AFF86C8